MAATTAVPARESVWCVLHQAIGLCSIVSIKEPVHNYGDKKQYKFCCVLAEAPLTLRGQ